MSSLARTIDRTLAAIGRAPREFLMETLAGFARLGLQDEERVSAIATAVASSAVLHYTVQRREFVEAVRIWALDAAVPGASRMPRIAEDPYEERIIEGADLLIGGVTQLQESLRSSAAPMADRLAAELTLYTRLLAAHDVHTILEVLAAVTESVGSAAWRPGDLVSVPLRDPSPVDRTADLGALRSLGRC